VGPLLDDLVRGRLSVITRLDDGSVGAHLVIQIDGDVTNNVSPRFLADPAAQDRHARAIRKLLAQCDRARWVARSTLTISAAAVAALLALQPSWHAIAASLILPFAVHACTRVLYRRAIDAALNRTSHRIPDLEVPPR
jgi:hypothetical protein